MCRASRCITARPATARAPVRMPVASARTRNPRSRPASPSRRASAARYTAARNAPTATARHPVRIEVGLTQLLIRSPAALPTGTRPDAIAPTAAPSMYGVRMEETANVRSMTRRSRGTSVADCSA